MPGTYSFTSTYTHWDFLTTARVLGLLILNGLIPMIGSSVRDSIFTYRTEMENGFGDVESAIFILFERSSVMVGTFVGNACPF